MMPPRNWAAYLMHSSNSIGRSTAWARGLIGVWTVLAIALGLMIQPAEAAPFAYVANDVSGTVSVFDTATNIVVATIPVGSDPFAVGITPDGRHVYVANISSNNVSVIATATNTVAATVPVGVTPRGVAITPDGTQAFVTNYGSSTVSVIATASNTV